MTAGFLNCSHMLRRRGQWDQSEAYFNRAERLDPRNVRLIVQHALSYKIAVSSHALRKLDRSLILRQTIPSPLRVRP